MMCILEQQSDGLQKFWMMGLKLKIILKNQIDDLKSPR